jgi:hypothetical protein
MPKLLCARVHPQQVQKQQLLHYIAGVVGLCHAGAHGVLLG